MRVPDMLLSPSKLAQDIRLPPSLKKQLQRSLVQWIGLNQYRGRVIFHHSPPEDSIVQIPPPTYRCRSQGKSIQFHLLTVCFIIGHEMQLVVNASYWDPVKKAYSVKYLTCHFSERLFAEGHSIKNDAIKRCGKPIGPNECYLTCVGCQVV